MSPPQAPKTSRHSFTNQRTTYQNDPVTVTSDKHFTHHDGDLAASSSSSMPHDEHEESQGTSMEELMSKMVNTHRKRHAITEQNILSSYATASKNMQNDIETSFDQHESEASAAHEAQLKRLQDLLHMKARIEAGMAKKLAELKASYSAHSQDLENVVKHRAQELK